MVTHGFAYIHTGHTSVLVRRQIRFDNQEELVSGLQDTQEYLSTVRRSDHHLDDSGSGLTI